jgi:hypothetical protein
MHDDQPLFEVDKDGQGPVDAAMGDFYDSRPALTVVDRSDLENYAECPFKGHCHRSGIVKPNSLVLLAGNVIHDALSAATLHYIGEYEELVNMGAQYHVVQSIMDFVMEQLLNSRPDLQAEAIDGMRASLKPWAWFLSEIHEANILGCDGGHAINRSSQYAKDYQDLGVRATSELDLIVVPESDTPEVLDIYDYKTGYSPHSHVTVAKAFQFRSHAVFAFDAFPEVQEINYRVWGTRFNKATHRAVFHRRDYHIFEAQLYQAVKTFADQIKKKKPDCWPVAEKCSECDCILHCPEANKEDVDIEKDPGGYIDQMGIEELKAKAKKKVATAMVNRLGGDIISPQGRGYGRNKPKEREGNPTLYEIE